MAVIRTNKLIPILVVIVLVIVGGVLFKSGGDKAKNVEMKSVPRPAAQSPDADTPSDTIRALTAEVTNVKDENKKLRDQNANLYSQNDELNKNRTAIEDGVTRKLTERFSSPEAANSPVFSALNSKIDNVTTLVEKYLPGAQAGGTNASSVGSDIPSGLGFDSKTGMATADIPVSGGANAVGASGVTVAAASQGASATIVWVEPLGSRTIMGPNNQPTTVRTAYSPNDVGQASAAGSLESALPPSGASSSADLLINSQQPPSTKNAYFTIPENAVLMDSVAMTTMIGRTPVNGNVRDPMQFKALIGRTNLAANGLEVPDDITGMVVSGIAVGDWMLSCVEGHINSVTFLFQDGTIKTISKRSSGGTQLAGNNSANQLGYITDEHGAACINGKQITNAPAYLTQVVGVKTLEVAARAAALSQTTTVANGLGSSTAVTGNQNQFVLGQAAAAGVDEVSSWLMKRLSDSFDAIYVPAGIKIAVHIDQELTIDKDSNSRRLDYGKANSATSRTRDPRASLD
jgi:integrating conjugative element protein (TIGR03752 family)